MENMIMMIPSNNKRTSKEALTELDLRLSSHKETRASRLLIHQMGYQAFQMVTNNIWWGIDLILVSIEVHKEFQIQIAQTDLFRVLGKWHQIFTTRPWLMNLPKESFHLLDNLSQNMKSFSNKWWEIEIQREHFIQSSWLTSKHMTNTKMDGQQSIKKLILNCQNLGLSNNSSSLSNRIRRMTLALTSQKFSLDQMPSNIISHQLSIKELIRHKWAIAAVTGITILVNHQDRDQTTEECMMMGKTRTSEEWNNNRKLTTPITLLLKVTVIFQ